MRLAEIEIGERYLWSVLHPTRGGDAVDPPTEVEAIGIVPAQRFTVRRGTPRLTNERRVVVRNLVNGVTRTAAARHLQPAAG